MLTQILRLRRITWWDDANKRHFEFITNNFELDAVTIALIYKYRWKIELYFKKTKTKLPIAILCGRQPKCH